MQTPYYVIHKEEMDGGFDSLIAALEQCWNNYVVGYSYKTNALPWIVKEYYGKGCYSEVVSEDEYELAKLLCADKSRIVYNGPIKTKDSFIEALTNGCFVNIDSSREIDWLDDLQVKDYNLGIRVNFDVEKMCPGQSQCAEEGGRFGFCFENGELKRAIDRIHGKGFKIRGIHLHTSSKSRGIDIYKAICETACRIKREYLSDLTFVDVGGGFFGGLPNKPQFLDYMSLISKILKQEFDPKSTTLIIEPGMSLIGSPVSYVTSVIDVKDTSYNRFVVTDGTRTSIDPLMTKSRYFNRYERNGSGKVLKKQVICGYTCMEHDRLYEANDEEELEVGDKIIYDKVGAYTMCLTPLFIKYFPKVYVEERGQLTLVRDAWTPKEYISKSVL